MINELLLVASLIFIFGSVVISYCLFGKAGLFGMTVISTVLANIEVLVLINAFGMEQTLGNVFFAATFLITDILSENESKKEADRAVMIGIFTAVFTLIATGFWFWFQPSENDYISPALRTVFSNTPRMMLSSLAVYALTQRFDVWLYHKWWDFTTKKCGDSHKFLWVRNNCATLASQLLNTVLFNVLAFAGKYDVKTLVSIIISSYVIFIFTSLLDTPAVYIARKLKEKGHVAT